MPRSFVVRLALLTTMAAVVQPNARLCSAGDDLQKADGKLQSAAELLRHPAPADRERALRARPPESAAGPAVTAESLRKQAADFAAAHLPERYDLAAGAKELEPGIEPVFRFVRDAIHYESYPGILRGSQLTFTGRAGNAFDRSLLLAELLRRQEIKVRFVRGRLPEDVARRLIDRIFEAPREKVPPAAGKSSSLHAAIQARATRDYAVIRKALSEKVPNKSLPAPADLLAEVQDHVWVQADVEGRWVDLDSSFSDAEPGKSFCKAAATFDKLPIDACQLVTIRIVAETLRGTALKQEKLLELSWPASGLLDREINLIHLPGAGAGLAGALAGGGQKDLWRPVLLIDDQVFGGIPLAFTEGKTGSGIGKPPTGGLGNVFGPRGALGTGGVLVAEWVEFEIQAPGAKPEIVRRALVDRAGAAWREAKTPDPKGLRPLLRDDQGPCAPRQVHNLWFSAGPHNLAAYAQALRAWFDPEPTADGKTSAKEKTKTAKSTVRGALWMYTMLGFALVIEADHAFIPALNDRPDCRFYCDSPRILMTTVGLQAGKKGLEPGLLVDLRRDRIRGVARDDAGQAAVAERKVWFGALEGALEHEFLVPFLRMAPEGTALLTTSALTSPGEAVALRSPAKAGAADWPVLPETAARARSSLTSGNVLVASRSALDKGPLAWWEIAPDGSTLAVLEEGNMGRIPIGTPNSGGGGINPGGVIPGPPGDIGNRGAHIPRPTDMGNPFPGETGIEWAPGYGPEGKGGGKPPVGEGEGGKGTGGGKKGASEEEAGGNEYVAVLLTQSVPNPLAVLGEYVDAFLLGSNTVAVAVSEAISSALGVLLE